jgi:hypothetical protein
MAHCLPLLDHWLDTRVYCLALAEHLGLSSLTADEWAGLAKERGGPAPEGQARFKAPQPVPQATPASPARPAFEGMGDAGFADRYAELAARNASLWGR